MSKFFISHSRLIARCALAAFILTSVPACDTLFPKEKKRHGKKAKKTKQSQKKGSASEPEIEVQYGGGTYLRHLELARLSLQKNPDVVAAAGDLERIQSYGEQSTGAEEQVIIILESKEKGRAIAPVSLAGKDDFPALKEVMKRLDGSYTLSDLRLASVSVSPADVPDFYDGETNQTQALLEQEQKRLVDSASRLSAIDDVNGQLQLLRFFMRSRSRDAAYLSADNIKQLLAGATQDKSIDVDALLAFSKELETLEAQLHKTMPFKL